MKPWWSKKYGKDKICAITHTRLRPKNSIYLRCGHGFVVNALYNMIKTGSTKCPLCRQNFNPNFI